MHEILQSQGIGRYVVWCALQVVGCRLSFIKSKKHWSPSKYCCISTKQLNITPNDDEITKKLTQNRTNQIKTNEEEQNRTKQNEQNEPIRDGCNG
jgi:hypothetical protein